MNGLLICGEFGLKFFELGQKTEAIQIVIGVIGGLRWPLLKIYSLRLWCRLSCQAA